jgi:hypothetical protein
VIRRQNGLRLRGSGSRVDWPFGIDFTFRSFISFLSGVWLKLKFCHERSDRFLASAAELKIEGDLKFVSVFDLTFTFNLNFDFSFNGVQLGQCRESRKLTKLNTDNFLSKFLH